MDAAKDRFTGKEIAVLRAIQRAGDYIGAAEIAAQTGLWAREVRRVIKDLVEDHKIPIVSLPGKDGGFCFTADPVEMEKNRRRKFQLAMQILTRARAFDKTGLAERMAGQLKMELEDGR